MNKVDERLADILNSYAAISALPDFHNKALEVAVQQIKSLFSNEAPIEERKEAFRRSVWSWNYKNKNKYNADTIKDFIDIWSRLENGRLKFEKEKVFKIGSRLATFVKHAEVFEQARELAKYKRALGNVNPLR